MVLFSDSDLQDLEDIANEFITDTSINTLIKYRRYIGEDYYDPEDQIISTRFQDWSGVSTIMTDVVLQEIEPSGYIQIGDTKFVIERSSVSGTISTQDIIVHSGTSYNVLKSKIDTLGITNICFGRQVVGDDTE